MKIIPQYITSTIKAALILISIGCQLSVVAQKKDPKFDIQAHRGGAGLMPENSIPSAINSVKNGWTIEMDLYMTKDSVLVVTHDPHILALYASYPDGKKVTPEVEKSLLIKDMTYEELRKFEIGLRENPTYPKQQKVYAYIPKFADLIDSAEHYAKKHHLPKPTYNIQAGPAYTISDEFRKDFVKKIMDIVLKKKIDKRAGFQSFDMGMLETMKRDYPKKIDIVMLAGVSGKNLEKALEKLTFKPDVYSPYFTIVTKEMVEKCHLLGIRIIPWTINNKDDLDKVKALGVDGIITDYPNLL
ncbi:MAG: glycerophosphodiester phosphodiesterase [Chryseobacterium sp.]|nr:MAG: glycerophosphodiester phosphodiesterase [Chryseobacterium sp.]